MSGVLDEYREFTDRLEGMVERGEVSPVWALMFHERMATQSELRFVELTGTRAERRRASRLLRRLPPLPDAF